jgi:ParB-like chromosome segregation protein Spo0J
LPEQLEKSEAVQYQALLDDMIHRLPTSAMVITSLLPAGSPRQAGIDASYAQLLAEIHPDQLPAILVHRATMRVIDGMHRLNAAMIRGDRTITGRYVECSESQAFLLAVRENSRHGMPLSRADREAAAGRVLADHPDWSDRAVAAAVGIGTATVATVRLRSSTNVTPLKGRVGRDGKRRPLDGAEGRQRAAELISARPSASLREIARETNISLGTARDVRERMRRGQDPVPRRQRGGGTDVRRPTPLSHGREKSQAGTDPWPSMRIKLRKDPAMRYSESGRALMAWLECHDMGPDGFKAFIDSVPAHWAGPVAELARCWSEEWRKFALELEQRG